MTTINNTVGQTNTAAQAGQSAFANADFNMFLKLLTTQMQNQDPLDPMDTSEYTQQLVQYSQVEQSMQQTSVLRDILWRLSSSDMAQAAAFIGREAEFDTNIAGFDGELAEWSYTLPREAVSITATIKDASGRTVATKILEPGTEGRFAWDGAQDSSGTASNGLYSLTLQALDSSGNNVPAWIRSVGTVSSITNDFGNVMLSVNGVDFPSTALVSVSAVKDG